MSLDLGNIIAHLQLDAASMEQGIKDATKQMQAMGEKLESVGKTMMLKVTAPIVAGVALALKNFAEEEDAINQLRSALSRTGPVSDATVNHFREFASSMQAVTKYGDEMILSQMAYAKNLGVNEAQLEDVTKAAIGLSAAYRMDLGTAMMLLGRAAKGQTQLFTRYGIMLKENTSAEEKYQEVLMKGMEAFGLAEAETRTLTGSIAQLRNALSDLLEIIGAAFAPTVQSIARDLKGLCETLQEVSPAAYQVAAKFALVLAAIGPLQYVLGKTLTTIAMLASSMGAAVTPTLLFANAAGVVLTAMVAWQTGSWLYKNSKDIRWLGDEAAAAGMKILTFLKYFGGIGPSALTNKQAAEDYKKEMDAINQAHQRTAMEREAEFAGIESGFGTGAGAGTEGVTAAVDEAQAATSAVIQTAQKSAVQDTLKAMELEVSLQGKINTERERELKMLQFSKQAAEAYGQSSKEYADAMERYGRSLDEINRKSAESEAFTKLHEDMNAAADGVRSYIKTREQEFDEYALQLGDLVMAGKLSKADMETALTKKGTEMADEAVVRGSYKVFNRSQVSLESLKEPGQEIQRSQLEMQRKIDSKMGELVKYQRAMSQTEGKTVA